MVSDVGPFQYRLQRCGLPLAANWRYYCNSRFPFFEPVFAFLCISFRPILTSLCYLQAAVKWGVNLFKNALELNNTTMGATEHKNHKWTFQFYRTHQPYTLTHQCLLDLSLQESVLLVLLLVLFLAMLLLVMLVLLLLLHWMMMNYFHRYHGCPETDLNEKLKWAYFGQK